MKRLLRAVVVLVLGFNTSIPIASAIEGPLYVGPNAVGISWIESDQMVHALGVEERFVFVGLLPFPFGTEQTLKAYSRFTGQEIGTLPTPPGGWRFMFMAQCDAAANKLYVWDGGGFPGLGIIQQPTLYVYHYSGTNQHNFQAEIVETVDFRETQYGVGWAADIELLPDGSLITADEIFGALWRLHPEDGSIELVVGPSTPTTVTAPSYFPPLGAAFVLPPDYTVPSIGDIPYTLFHLPGSNYTAYRDGYLYFTNAAHQSIERIAVAVFDNEESTEARAAHVETVSVRPPELEYEILGGMTFNQYNEDDPWLYSTDPWQERVMRVNVETGVRETVLRDVYLMNAVHAVEFAPPVAGVTPLFIAMDQEHRLALINPLISEDLFQFPWRVAKLWVNPH